MAFNRERFVRQYQQAQNTKGDGDFLCWKEGGRKAFLAMLRCVKKQELSDCLFLIPFLKDTEYLYEALRELNKRWPQKEKEIFFDQVVDVFDKEDMDEMVLISLWARNEVSLSCRLWDVAQHYQAFGERMQDWAWAVRTKVKTCLKHNDHEGLKKLQGFNLCNTHILGEIVATEAFDGFVTQQDQAGFSFRDYDEALDIIIHCSLPFGTRQKRAEILLEKLLKEDLTPQYVEGLYLLFEDKEFSFLQSRLLKDYPHAKPSELRIFMARAVRMQENAFDMTPKVEVGKQDFSKIALNAIKKQQRGQKSGSTKRFLEKLKKHVENLNASEISKAVYDVLTMPDPYQFHHARKKATLFAVFSDCLSVSQKISYLLACGTQKNVLLFTQVVRSLDAQTLQELDEANLRVHCGEEEMHILRREKSKKEKKLLHGALEEDKNFTGKNATSKQRVM